MSQMLDEDVQVIELPVDVNDGDHDRFQHYFSKADINKNLMHGVPMRALCGKIVTEQVDPKGRTVCETCKYELEHWVGSNLPEGERD